MTLRLLAFFTACLHLAAEEALGPLGPWVKMIPVAVLSALVFQAEPTKARRAAATGLLVASFADLAIEFSFLGGLATFLLAHLFYIVAFTRLSPRWRFSRFAGPAVWGAFFLPLLVGGAGPLAIPVAAYGVVILVMMWRAAAVASAWGWNRGTIGLLGALLFGVSDTLLGYTRFVSAWPGSGVLIMLTYWAAQAFIAHGFLMETSESEP